MNETETQVSFDTSISASVLVFCMINYNSYLFFYLNNVFEDAVLMYQLKSNLDWKIWGTKMEWGDVTCSSLRKKLHQQRAPLPPNLPMIAKTKSACFLNVTLKFRCQERHLKASSRARLRCSLALRMCYSFRAVKACPILLCLAIRVWEGADSVQQWCQQHRSVGQPFLLT